MYIFYTFGLSDWFKAGLVTQDSPSRLNLEAALLPGWGC